MINTTADGKPIPIFTVFSTVAVIVGIVVGIGIFRLPPLVAENADTGLQFLSFWLVGGLISLLGALCYAELASSRPDAGGEYHFLTEAYGPSVGFLFSWGRMTVIQTGSIALAAFILGDYASLMLDLGPYSSAIYAAATVVLLTAVNLWGTWHAQQVQNVTAAVVVLLLTGTALINIFVQPPAEALQTTLVPGSGEQSAAGLAMIFVLLTYGGWNEAAYLSAELQSVRKNMARVLVLGIGLITLLYLLVNYAYLHILGLETLRSTDTIGVALTESLLGSGGTLFIATIVIIAALSTTNATIITGARTNYALGRDFPLLRFLGKWSKQHNSPVNALYVQGGIALMLVFLGAFTEEAVATMVDYTAPVFWFFLLLVTFSLFIFRRQNPGRDRGYSVPLYPAPPLLFMGACGYMLYSSVTFTGIGALWGLGILAVGVPLLVWVKK